MVNELIALIAYVYFWRVLSFLLVNLTKHICSKSNRKRSFVTCVTVQSAHLILRVSRLIICQYSEVTYARGQAPREFNFIACTLPLKQTTTL